MRSILHRGARTVAVALTALLLVTGCGYSGMGQLPLPGGPDVGDDSYVVRAEFDDVLNLAPQSTVKSNGVTVGRVERIGRDGWQAVLEMRLRGDVALPADVQARVAQTSLLGEKFVDLVRPDTGTTELLTDVLTDGDVIPLARTGRGAEVEEVLGSLSLLLNGGGVAQLQTISRELHAALDSEQVDTRRFLTELDTFVGALDDNRDRIVGALEGLDRLSATINDDRRVVEEALDEIPLGVAELADQREELVAALEDLDRFSDVGADVVRRAGDDIAADLAALRPTLAQLAEAGDTLPQALKTILTFPYPDEILDAIHSDYVNLAVEIDLTLLKTITSLGGGGLADPLQNDDPVASAVPALPTVEELVEDLGLSRLTSSGGGLFDLLLGGGRR